MQNKSYTDDWKDRIRNTRNAVAKWLDDHDSGSWPAFIAFFAVVTAGMIFNVDAFAPVVGLPASIAIGSFFEYAILAWKITTNRKRNDAKQNQIAYTALWLSVGLALTMLVVNMFRIGGDAGFETTSYIIVGITAGVQLIGYLLFDGADPDKEMKRQHSQNERGILRKDQETDFVISEVEADARIIRTIGDKLNQIRVANADLPPELMEPLLEEARQKLLKGYSSKTGGAVDQATKPMADLNGDGKIGGGVEKTWREVTLPPSRKSIQGDGYELARQNAAEIGRRLHSNSDDAKTLPDFPGVDIGGVDRGETFTEAPPLAPDETPSVPTDANEPPKEPEPDF